MSLPIRRDTFNYILAFTSLYLSIYIIGPISSYHTEVLQRIPHTVVIHGRRDVVGCRPCFVAGIAHGDAYSGATEDSHVVAAVADVVFSVTGGVGMLS